MSISSQTPPRLRSLPDVILALDALCGELRPGDRVPTHTELMRRLRASERMVLRALEELQRSGRVVRRNGVGTFVTDAPAARRRAPIVPHCLAEGGTVVAISTPDHSFFDRCVSQLFQHADAAGLALLCRVLDERTPLEPLPPAAGGPVGYLAFSYRLAPLALRLQRAGCRVVLVGAPPAGDVPEVPCVYGDHEQGGYLATRHLLDLGHRRIAFQGHLDLPRTLRWRGYQRALREAERAGATVQSESLSPVEFGAWERDPSLAASRLRQPEGPTGLVAWNDHEAVRLLGVLARAQVKVPQDVSLVGYDDLPEGKLVHPALTTVDQGMGQQLRAALDLLTAPVAPSPSRTMITLPALIERQSTAPPPGA